MTELIQAGKLVPVIDRRYRLIEVPEALAYLGEGRAKGKVVIIVDHSNACTVIACQDSRP
jgi:NADPH:quinone reductase-like Zn-dependent oxidoreductase